MKKIYVVTSGSYSDYGIDAIFDDKELAEKFISSFKSSGWNEMSVEEWDLNPFEKEIRKGMSAFFVRMKKDGTCLDVRKEDTAFGLGDHGFDMDKNMYTHYFAKDEKHAVKVANERRAQLIADNKW